MEAEAETMRAKVSELSNEKIAWERVEKGMKEKIHKL
jgi:hypothetical protein